MCCPPAFLASLFTTSLWPSTHWGLATFTSSCVGPLWRSLSSLLSAHQQAALWVVRIRLPYLSALSPIHRILELSLYGSDMPEDYIEFDV